MKPRFYPFWSINDALCLERLVAQLVAFKAHGFDGVVFHPRYYPNQPEYLSGEYFDVLSELILEAKSHGLDFWIYDENGWPSGTVDGKLLKQHIKDRQLYLNLVEQRPANPLYVFEQAGRTWYVELREGPGVDYFSPAFTRHFIEMTYERYRAELSPEAFAHVTTFFCDEPEFGLGHVYESLSPHGSLPWTAKLPSLFFERYGIELNDALPGLFMEVPGFEELRVQFRELLTDLFCENFLRPLSNWCSSHGKVFTAHIKGEEHPLFQVGLVGSCHQVHRHVQLPGIDALERFPSGNFYPRQVVSAAHQFGNGNCMVECFGGAGWGASPEDLERYLLWLGENGLTHFVLHLAQYRLDSEAIRDWPASQPFHLNWASCYKDVLARVRARLAVIDPRSDSLYIAPYRTIMAKYNPWELPGTNIHNAATCPDSPAARINRRFVEHVEELVEAGVRPHFCDERSFEAFAEARAGGIQLANMLYKQIIVDADTRLSHAAKALLQGVSAAPPSPVSNQQRPATVFSRSCKLDWELLSLPENSLLIGTKSIATHQHEGIFTCLCEFDGGDTFVLHFADEVISCELNGIVLDNRALADGWGSISRCNVLPGKNRLQFTTAKPVTCPYVWIRGSFNVESRTPFTPGPNYTIRSKGGFALSAPKAPMGEWVSHGYPFMRDSVKARASLELPEPVSRIRFDHPQCDALCLRVDDGQPMWIWGPRWTFSFNEPVDTGPHELEVAIIPSTFNTFGPHRYLGGDAPLISPDQFSGKRNFADPVGFPAFTLGDFWHFKPVKLPDQLCF